MHLSSQSPTLPVMNWVSVARIASVPTAGSIGML